LEEGGIVKKILFLFLIIIFLTGCSKDNDENEYVFLEEAEYMPLIDEFYADFINVYTDCSEAGELQGSYVLSFDNFEEMMNGEYSDFVYGRVVYESELGCYARSLFVEVFETGFSDERKIIRLSVMNTDGFIGVGGIYVLNLSYLEDYDRYCLTQQSDSVFRVLSGKIGVPSLFTKELEDRRDINVFLDYVLDEK
jgi:hypothetical protein